MPYVNIRITEVGATSEQKANLIEGVTNLLRDVLGKNPATTVVVIDEVPTDNWGIAGESQKHFDPLWGMVDPAAGTWFPTYALDLAETAQPPLLP